MDINKIVKDYDSLVARALDIVDKAPYWKHCGEDGFARLSIKGGQATLSWPEVETFYDSTTIESNSITFPAHLLRLNDADLVKWKATEMLEYKKREAEQQAARKTANEAAMRAEYDRLKKIFG